MAELKPQKRYALAVIYIRSQFAQTLDDAADLFVRMLQNLDNQARNKLGEYQQEHLQRTDRLIGQLKRCCWPTGSTARIINGWRPSVAA
jgi:hypothetical protein